MSTQAASRIDKTPVHIFSHYCLAASLAYTWDNTQSVEHQQRTLLSLIWKRNLELTNMARTTRPTVTLGGYTGPPAIANVVGDIVNPKSWRASFHPLTPPPRLAGRRRTRLRLAGVGARLMADRLQGINLDYPAIADIVSVDKVNELLGCKLVLDYCTEAMGHYYDT